MDDDRKVSVSCLMPHDVTVTNINCTFKTFKVTGVNASEQVLQEPPKVIDVLGETQEQNPHSASHGQAQPQVLHSQDGPIPLPDSADFAGLSTLAMLP